MRAKIPLVVLVLGKRITCPLSLSYGQRLLWWYKEKKKLIISLIHPDAQGWLGLPRNQDIKLHSRETSLLLLFILKVKDDAPYSILPDYESKIMCNSTARHSSREKETKKRGSKAGRQALSSP